MNSEETLFRRLLLALKRPIQLCYRIFKSNHRKMRYIGASLWIGRASVVPHPVTESREGAAMGEVRSMMWLAFAGSSHRDLFRAVTRSRPAA